jgi:hypothetical protein
VAQVAFVVVLVFATATFVTSFIRVVTTDLGFDYQNRVVFTVSSARMSPGRDASPLLDELLAHVRAVPGVQHAGYIESGLPLTLGGGLTSVGIKTAGMRNEDRLSLNLHEVSPGYQEAAGLRLVEGRLLDVSDRVGAPLVMLLSEPAARRLFPGRSAVGQSIEFRGTRQVVGVVEGIRVSGPESDRRMALYLPLAGGELHGSWLRSLVVQSTGPVEAVTAPVAAVIQRYLPPGQSAPTPQFLTEAFNTITESRRFQARLMTAFGALALLIGAFGIYSVISTLVVQQTKEIGVRMAMGASGAAIVRMVLRHMLVLVAGGVAAGVSASWLLARWLSTVVFETDPASPILLGTVVLIVVTAGTAAALLPAVRASRVNPVAVLRAN